MANRLAKPHGLRHTQTVVTESASSNEGRLRWRLRLRLYGLALIVALVYLLMGRLISQQRSWVEVDLWTSTGVVLMLGVASVEAYFIIQRLQQRYRELAAARAREIELAERLSEQQRQILNQIARALLDRLNVHQLAPDVLEKMALLFETDVLGVWLCDRQPPYLLTPCGFSGLSPATAKELGAIGRGSPCFEKALQPPRQLVVTDFRRDSAPPLAAFCEREGLTQAVFTPVLSRDGAIGVLAVFYRKNRAIPSPLASNMETVAHLLASAVQAEELCHAVAESQKIDSLPNLAGGIAHDFNNVLAATLACVSYIKQHIPAQSDLHRYLAVAEANIHRGAALSKQLLAFGQLEASRLSVVNPNSIIENALNFLERSFDTRFRIQRRLTPDLHPVEINESQLDQLVLNICLNAREAMPHGGTLTVSTRNLRLDSAAPERAVTRLPDGDYVLLSFRDTGVGMDEAVRQRMFEPFFTTKPGQGRGLGLALVQNIVQRAGGDIRVESAPGQGTLFEVFLPASSKPLAPAATPSQTPAPRGNGEHILLAEEEEVIREMTQLALESRGYKVTTAADGATALALYLQHGKEFDLVIADLVMPRLSGAELLARLKEVNPNVRVIISSGFSRDLEGQRVLQQGCLGYLQKPYDPQTLHELVRSVLDADR